MLCPPRLGFFVVPAQLAVPAVVVRKRRGHACKTKQIALYRFVSLFLFSFFIQCFGFTERHDPFRFLGALSRHDRVPNYVPAVALDVVLNSMCNLASVATDAADANLEIAN